MKSFGTTCSVAYNSNRVVSSCQCHWGKVKPGAFLQFAGEDKHYKIIESKDLYYIKNFEIKNKNALLVNDNIFPDITPKDSLEISYKEYELLELGNITNPGKGYNVGDLIYLNGGNLSPDLNTSVILKVKGVNQAGGVSDVEIFHKGKYLLAPSGSVQTTTNGVGERFEIVVNFQELGKRGFLDRTIFDIKYNGGQSIITLSQALPDGLPNGKLSVKKWELFLETPYLSKQQNIVNQSYEILNDFIPHIDVPKMIRGHSNPDVIINHGFQKIAEKLKSQDDSHLSLTERVKLLEEKLEKLILEK